MVFELAIRLAIRLFHKSTMLLEFKFKCYRARNLLNSSMKIPNGKNLPLSGFEPETFGFPVCIAATEPLRSKKLKG
jgi:hypothetical protein